MLRSSFVVASLLLAGCASQTSKTAVGSFETVVPKQQLGNVARDVQEWHDFQYPNCKYRTVSTVSVLSREKDTAHEKWVITACENKQYEYAVFVMLHEGGISDSVGNIDGSGMKVHSSN